MKQQIVSLKILRQTMYDVLQTLFSFISLNELSQLRSLILVGFDFDMFSKISSILPLLTKLRYFRMTDSSVGVDKVLNPLSTSTIQTLSIPILAENLVLAHPFTSLVNLNLSLCSVADWCHFCKYLPELRSLSIESIYYGNQLITETVRLSYNHAIHLKRLVIHNFVDEFDSLEILLQRTPNLKFLMISNTYNADIVNAGRWQRLITTSLPFLDVFKFKFSIELENEDIDILDKFGQFQTEFWHQQHHWYIECTCNKDEALIYTLPYIWNTYEITQYTKRYYNPSVNNVNTFTKITDLTLCPEAIINPYHYYFPNVESLKLENIPVGDNCVYSLLNTKHIECLKTIVNLCHLTHLDISSECRLKSPYIMLQLLREAPYISSLKINKDALFSLLNNDQLCECFNQRIKKLDFISFDDTTYLGSNEIAKLCRIFSNMEQFRCNISHPEHWQLILNQLSKLLYLKAFSYETDCHEADDCWLRDHASELNLLSFKVNCESCVDDDDDFDFDYSVYDSD
jgi:thiol-disulfide isomerase/thioredoxin